MNSATEQMSQMQPRTPSGAMLRTLGGVAMLSGFLVVMVFQWTQPIIEENKRIAIEKALFKVVPGASSQKNFALSADGRIVPQDQAQPGDEKIYAAFSDKGELQGMGLEAAATGYQDVIRVLYGYSPKCRCITGMKVLKMAETPGLGDKIDKDPAFLKNFYALDARPAKDGKGLANPIVTVKHGSKTEKWQIDAISGATISSKAVGRMLNQSAQKMVPAIEAQLDRFKAE